jgi:hypothetical protein
LALHSLFAPVALGQHGNWFEPIPASPKPIFREYNAFAVPLKSSEPSLLSGAFDPLSESLDVWNARIEARETRSGKSAALESQAVLQPGILQAAGQASVKPRSMAKIPIDTLPAGRKSWIHVGPGSLPLALTIQPDATQKYGADPATLQVYFGHRR